MAWLCGTQAVRGDAAAAGSAGHPVKLAVLSQARRVPGNAAGRHSGAGSLEVGTYAPLVIVIVLPAAA